MSVKFNSTDRWPLVFIVAIIVQLALAKALEATLFMASAFVMLGYMLRAMKQI